MTQALVVQDDEDRAPMRRPTFGGLAIQGVQDLMQFARLVLASGFAPKGSTLESVAISVQFGAEIGLTPMQAIQNVGVINGKPSLYGDAPLALCKQHPLWGGMREWIEGDGDMRVARCEVKRMGDCDVVRSFSVADAKQANLWKKAGPWTNYPDRMLLFRARGFALRDAFPDALKGLITEQEARDYPEPQRQAKPLRKPAELLRKIEDNPAAIEAPSETEQPKQSSPAAELRAERLALLETYRELLKETGEYESLSDDEKREIAKMPLDKLRESVASMEAFIRKRDEERGET